MTARTFYIEAKKITYSPLPNSSICMQDFVAGSGSSFAPARELVTFKTIDLEDATPDASQELWHQLTCTLNED